MSGSYTLESDPNGMRFAHASVMFGGGELAADETQMINVGGSINRLDLGAWLRLSKPDKDAKPLSYYLRNAKLNVAKLDYLGLAFRDVALDLTVNERNWRINSGGDNVVGSITIPSAAGAAEPWDPAVRSLAVRCCRTRRCACRPGCAAHQSRPPRRAVLAIRATFRRSIFTRSN